MHRAGRPAEAADVYQRYLDAGAAGDIQQRQKAQQYLQQARGEAAPLPEPAASTAAPVSAALSTPSDKREAAAPTPLYKRWWLWTAVGVGAAGLGLGLGLGLSGRRPDLSDAAHAYPF